MSKAHLKRPPLTKLDEAFIDAVNARDYPQMQRLLHSGANINCAYFKVDLLAALTAVHVAVLQEDQTLLQFLLDNGADPNKRAAITWGWTPLSLAVEKEVASMIPLLLVHGADPYGPVQQLMPMWMAATKNKPEIVRQLLGLGLSIDRGNPILKTAHNGHAEMVQLLIELGADTAVLSQPPSETAWTPRMENAYYKRETRKPYA